MTKQYSLFDEAETMPAVKRSRRDIHEDYDSFVKKFDKSAPKTTDDCYTPQPVYNAVLEWLGSRVNLDGRSIVRPFYPGGDYKNDVLPEACVVVDNPPFSILSEILRFYCAAKVDFFLFAPALTLFVCQDLPLTYVVASANVVYENGANVRTSFITNLFPENKIVIASDLREKIEKCSMCLKPRRANVYPANFVTSALLGKFVARGVNLEIPSVAVRATRDLDALRRRGAALFGGGILLLTNMQKC